MDEPGRARHGRAIQGNEAVGGGAFFRTEMQSARLGLVYVCQEERIDRMPVARALHNRRKKRPRCSFQCSSGRAFQKRWCRREDGEMIWPWTDWDRGMRTSEKRVTRDVFLEGRCEGEGVCGAKRKEQSRNSQRPTTTVEQSGERTRRKTESSASKP